ncbi:hypothetical protein SAMN02910356_00084 [Selenomonas sp. GACV-9]|uniref:sel1 repeat family protein n=1 Tax=Selenomonas sp. GACV-9 TaxID=3158782 RepID=UPI0008F3E2D8|nr:hypothetical protein SAMN02910356_00084 [Selenomonas ruminantium]
MVDKAYMLTRNNEWQKSSDRVFRETDITELPYRLIVGSESSIQEQLIWCQKHRQFEAVRSDSQEETISDFGCKFTGVYVLVMETPDDIHQEDAIEAKPTRWRIYQKKTLSPIFVAADVAKLRFMVTPGKGETPAFLSGVRVEWVVRSISIDVAKDKFIYNSLYTQRHIKYRYRYELIPIPAKITNELFSMLINDAEMYYGVEPIKDDAYTGFVKIKNFMAYPLNRNVIEIQKIRDNRRERSNDFQELFPRNQRDIGAALCQYIGIDNPPQSLVDTCSENIYAALNYKVYQAFGFKSEKAIARLWNNKSCFGKKLLDLKYDEADKTSFWWKRTANFIAWLLKDSDEVVIAEMLSNTYYHSYEEIDTEEMLDIFSRSKKRLPKPVLEQFKKEGFTFEVYNVLKRTEFLQNFLYMDLNIPVGVQEFECNINGYNFRLVRHTLYLRRISEAMDSKLEYRWQEIADYSTILFTIDINGIYVAYIEVRWDVDRYTEKNKFEVISLCGPNDRPVPLFIKLLCYYWAALNRFYGADGALKLDREEKWLYRRTKYRVQQLDPNSVVYDNYHLDEMLDLPAYTRTTGYYVILERRLRKQENIQRMSMASWQSADDESSYLQYLLPWITPIWEDAQHENPGAEYILGLIYSSGRYIPVNKEREAFWLKRSARHGYLPAMEKLANSALQDGNKQYGKEIMVKAAKLGSDSAFSWCVENVTPVEYAILG